MYKRNQDYIMPIEWLTSMLDINLAIKIKCEDRPCSGPYLHVTVAE